MQAHWLSLFPPLFVIVTAFVTKQLNLSLLLGVAFAALIATDGNIMAGGSLLVTRIYEQMIDPDTAFNYIFLVIISSLIVLISRTGGAIAFAHAITKRLKTVKMVETASLCVSSTLFIDDYLSNLTTGYAMRSLTDRFFVPRVKLAYLVHSLSSPLLIISPISSWVAVLTGQIEKAGISTQLTEGTRIIGEPFMVYVQSIPFIFYSFLLIASVWFVVRMGISFGPMKTQEQIAGKNGNLYGGKQAPTNTMTLQEKSQANALDLLIPVGTLIASVFVSFLYAGGFYLFGGTRSFTAALQNNTQAPMMLLFAGIFTLIVSFIFALQRRTITPKDIGLVFYEGTIFIYSAILLIFLATTLGLMLRLDLHTGAYIASLVQGTMPLWLLPCTLFLVATAVAFVTGSTWGTIALMTPIGLQVLISLSQGTAPYAVDAIPMLLPVIGGIFAGAICGNHITPISDTTMLSSASCGAYPLDHIQTQLPYVLPVIISSCVAFMLAGLLIGYGVAVAVGVSMGVGLASCLGSLYCINAWYNRRP